MKLLLGIGHLVVLAVSVSWAQTHGGSTSAQDSSLASTIVAPDDDDDGDQGTLVATTTLLSPSSDHSNDLTTTTPPATVTEDVVLTTTEVPQEIPTEDPAKTDGEVGEVVLTSSSSNTTITDVTLRSVSPEIETPESPVTNNDHPLSTPASSSPPTAESQETTTPAPEEITQYGAEDDRTTTTPASPTSFGELDTVAPQGQPATVSTIAPEVNNGNATPEIPTLTTTTKIPLITTTTTPSEYNSDSSIDNVSYSSVSGGGGQEEGTDVSNNATATETQQGSTETPIYFTTTSATTTVPSTTNATTAATNSTPAEEVVSPAADESSGICFGEAEVNTVVVVGVVVGVNVLAVVVTALCVHRIVSRRLTWDPPPIYYRRSTRGGQGKPGGPQSGVNLASDSDCKTGEGNGGGQAGTHIPILITNEDGWCVPYNDQDGKKKKDKTKDGGVATVDTGV